MSRLVAIDYGRKRTGLAATDPLQLIASPLDTVATPQLIDYLKKYDTTEGIAAFVVGMPRKLDNTDTNVTADVRAFVKRLSQHFPGKSIHLHDERFTSKLAMDAMISGGMKKKDRQKKENVDKVSAAIILQSYMETR